MHCTFVGVTSENDFQWLCQLRYYWEETCVMARIINAIVKYHCEYLGNSGRYIHIYTCIHAHCTYTINTLPNAMYCIVVLINL